MTDLRRRLAVALAAGFAVLTTPAPVSSQEAGQEVPKVAGYPLYSIDDITGTNDHFLLGNMRSFYLNALKNGRMTSDLYSEYTMISPEGSELSTGDLIDFAKSFQCSYRQDAAAQIVYRHVTDHWQGFRYYGDATDSASNAEKLWFLVPGPYPDISPDQPATSVSIPFNVGVYIHPDGYEADWKNQAVSDPVAFREAMDAFLSLHAVDLVPEPADKVREPGVAYRMEDTVQYLTVRSVADGSRCQWDEAIQDWVVVFDDAVEPGPETPNSDSDMNYDPDYQPEDPGVDDEIDFSQWRYRDHDGDGKANFEDPDYDSEGDHDGDGTPNKYDADYDDSDVLGYDTDSDGVPDRWDGDDDNDGIPDGEDPTPGGDSALEGEEICVDDGEGGCRDMNVLPSPDYGALTGRVAVIFQQFVDTSAIRDQGVTPAFSLPGFDAGVMAFDGAEVELPAVLLTVLGWMMIAGATWFAIRQALS